MPIKSDTKLMYSIDGKEFVELTEIPEIETTNLCDAMQDNSISRINEALFQSEVALSLYFNFANKGLYFLRIIGAEPTRENIMRYRNILQKISLNNWLRRHGLPMRRRGRQ